MKSDYFLKKHIITTYSDYKNNIYQIDVFDKETKTTYRVTDLKIIEKVKDLYLKILKKELKQYEKTN